MFQDPAPNRDEVISALSRALQDDDVPVYFDTSVLLRCYELSAKARDELLSTFEVLAGKVRIPLWTAKEIFTRTRGSSPGNPFTRPRQEVLGKLKDFKDLAHRYVDDDGAPTERAEDFFEQLAGIESEFRQMTARLTSHRIDAERITALLVPLVNQRVLASDLDAIVGRAGREGELRFSHGLPPGPGDGPGLHGTGGDIEASRGRGKKHNRYGDLIIWWEILDDLILNERRTFVIVTCDVTKGDMVYAPRHLSGPEGNLIENSTLTLPHPMLVAEARKVADAVGVHVISLDQYSRLMGGPMGLDLPNLLRALQKPPEADSSDSEGTRATGRPNAEARGDALEANAGQFEDYVRFTGLDLSYALDEADEVDRLIGQIRSADWQVIGRAFASDGVPVANASREQMLHIGAAIAQAVNARVQIAQERLEGLLLGPENLTNGEPLSRRQREYLLLGVLASVYIGRDGTPVKPVASHPLSEIVFAAFGRPGFSDAFEDILNRLSAAREAYLRLPDEGGDALDISLLSERVDEGVSTLLQAVAYGDIALLERDVPRTRQLVKVGDEVQLSVDELRTRIADEFAVPLSLIAIDRDEFQLLVPRGLGFVRWGPGTGMTIRSPTVGDADEKA